MFFKRKIILIAMAMSLGGLTFVTKAATIADFKVAKASGFIDASFSFTSYAKSLGADEALILSGLDPKQISDRHVVYPAVINRPDKKPEVHLLVLGHGFQLDAILVYDAALFMSDPVGIMAGLYEDGDLHELFYAGRIISYELFSGIGRLTKSKKKSAGGIYSIMRGNNGKGFEKVTLENVFSQGNEASSEREHEVRTLYFRGKRHQDLMSIVDFKHGRLLRNSIYGYGGGCTEEIDFSKMACQRERYDLSIKDGVLLIDRYPIDRDPIHLVKTGIEEVSQEGDFSSYDIARTFLTVEPLTSTGDMSIVRTDSNPLLEDLGMIYDVSLNPTAIVFGNTAAGFSHSTVITNTPMSLSPCRYTMMTRSLGGNGQEDKLIALDVCQMRTSLEQRKS